MASRRAAQQPALAKHARSAPAARALLLPSFLPALAASAAVPSASLRWRSPRRRRLRRRRTALFCTNPPSAAPRLAPAASRWLASRARHDAQFLLQLGRREERGGGGPLKRAHGGAWRARSRWPRRCRRPAAWQWSTHARAGAIFVGYGKMQRRCDRRRRMSHGGRIASGGVGRRSRPRSRRRRGWDDTGAYDEQQQLRAPTARAAAAASAAPCCRRDRRVSRRDARSLALQLAPWSSAARPCTSPVRAVVPPPAAVEAPAPPPRRRPRRRRRRASSASARSTPRAPAMDDAEFAAARRGPIRADVHVAAPGAVAECAPRAAPATLRRAPDAAATCFVKYELVSSAVAPPPRCTRASLTGTTCGRPAARGAGSVNIEKLRWLYAQGLHPLDPRGLDRRDEVAERPLPHLVDRGEAVAIRASSPRVASARIIVLSDATVACAFAMSTAETARFMSGSEAQRKCAARVRAHPRVEDVVRFQRDRRADPWAAFARGASRAAPLGAGVVGDLQRLLRALLEGLDRLDHLVETPDARERLCRLVEHHARSAASSCHDASEALVVVRRVLLDRKDVDPQPNVGARQAAGGASLSAFFASAAATPANLRDVNVRAAPIPSVNSPVSPTRSLTKSAAPATSSPNGLPQQCEQKMCVAPTSAGRRARGSARRPAPGAVAGLTICCTTSNVGLSQRSSRSQKSTTARRETARFDGGCGRAMLQFLHAVDDFLGHREPSHRTCPACVARFSRVGGSPRANSPRGLRRGARWSASSTRSSSPTAARSRAA